jgi:uncharacterized protein (TIGR00369 family)
MTAGQPDVIVSDGVVSDLPLECVRRPRVVREMTRSDNRSTASVRAASIAAWISTTTRTTGRSPCAMCGRRSRDGRGSGDTGHPSRGGSNDGLGRQAATLLDSCMGLAVHSTLERGLDQTTLEFKISLVRPVTPDTGRVRAEGTVVFRGRRISTAEGRLTDGQGRLLAHGTTTCLIFEC